MFLAIKPPENAAERDRALDFAHLIRLLDRYGAPHPAPGAGHYSGTLGRSFLKWEMHTEFVTYTLFADAPGEPPFSGDLFRLFPQDWLADAPGKVVTSAIVQIDVAEPDDVRAKVAGDLMAWFVPESLAVSSVVDREAVIAADFRLDENGHSRMAVLARREIGARRLGRIVQRLLEIETYKCMAMLTLPHARTVAAAVARLDRELSDIVGGMVADSGHEVETLHQLLAVSAEIEALSSTTAFRFGAAEAYEAIVNQRIQVLREERIGGRQLFGEFMLRRFDPAMRTCRSSKERLDELSARAGAGGEPAAHPGRRGEPAAEPPGAATDVAPGGAAAAPAGDGGGAVGGGDQLLCGEPGGEPVRPAREAHPLLDKTVLTALLTIPVVVVVFADGPPHPRPPRPPRRARRVRPHADAA